MEASVEFRFSQRWGDETTAHETGIFLYSTVDDDGKRQNSYVHLEALIEWFRFCVRIHQYRLLEKLQQHFVQPTQFHNRTVVALHELFDGERVARIFVAQHLGETRLVVEQEAVLAPSRQHVQGVTYSPQECLAVV